MLTEQEMETLPPAVKAKVQKILDAYQAMQGELRELRVLAKIGTWHDDCRPNREMAARELAKSQAIIDKLADEITSLQAQINAALDRERALREWLVTQRDTAEAAANQSTDDAMIASQVGAVASLRMVLAHLDALTATEQV